MEAVAPLEDVPGSRKDWHPDSDGKVLDLVHPSLYPVVYGRSMVLRDNSVGVEDCIQKKCGLGEVIPAPAQPKEEDHRGWRRDPSTANLYSVNFQWLSCEVKFAQDGGVR